MFLYFSSSSNGKQLNMSMLINELQEVRKAFRLLEKSVTRKLGILARKLSICVEYIESKKNVYSDALPYSADLWMHCPYLVKMAW